MEKNMHSGATKFHFQRARELRNNSTYSESLLWGYLKTKPKGIKFRRQHPYSIYILDFYCHSFKLAIELDGSIHNMPENKENDKIRQQHLENDGLIVMRFTNDLVENNFEKVIKEIESFLVKNKDEKKR
jgi:imidazole glycerol-phosphate synthase subunit HisF